MGLPLTGEPYEFISKKDNFEKQKKEDYKEIYSTQLREEMPTLEVDKRKNFNEVELGYSEQQAYGESLRCLECGCTEYYSCDLKKYATEYGSVQTKYGGDYKKYRVDFSHPFIEIDNNKCILCSRCVRICSQVVNANALGLINRGFELMSLQVEKNRCLKQIASHVECVSQLVLQVQLRKCHISAGSCEKLIHSKQSCIYCSVRCDFTIYHKSGFVMKVTGNNGLVDSDSNICRLAKFGYNYLNNKARLTSPLLKVNGGSEEIPSIKHIRL